MSRALAFLRRHPDLVLAWLCVLTLPALVAMMPLDLSLQPLLDLRPAADALVVAPADDGLWEELLHAQPTLAPLAFGSLVVTLLVGAPLLWLLCSVIAARALQVSAPLGRILARGLGVSLLVVPLRILVWIGAAVGARVALRQETTDGALPYALGAAFLYVGATSALSVFVDVLRGAALVELEAPLARVLGRGLAQVARRPRAYLGLWALDLALFFAAALPALSTRPLGIFDSAHGALALVGLGIRAAGGVAGVAMAATDVASRSA